MNASLIPYMISIYNINMDDKIKQWIREQILRDKSIGVMLKFEKGKVYWIPKHHMYLNMELITAQPVLLGKGSPPKRQHLMHGKFAYLIEPLK